MKERLLIGVISTDCYIEFQRDIMNGIISQAFKSNCDVVVISPLNNFYYQTDNKLTEKEIFNFILSDRFDGFLYNRNSFYAENIRNYIDELCTRSEKPVMLLDHNDHKRFETATADDCASFEKIVDHLIEEHGYKKIYCLTGPKNVFSAQERLQGYFNSMKNHNLHYDKNCYFYGDFWTEFSTELADKILKGEIPKPDAIACANDIMAVTICERLIGGGINVPEEIAVTGYDASLDAYRMNPSITSYQRPNYQLGAEAFRRLYRIITGKICQKIPDAPGSLRIGRSCGCDENPRLKHTIQRRMKVDESFETRLSSGDMLIEINNADNLSQLIDVIDRHTYLLHKMSRMFFCLTKNCEDAINTGSELSRNFSVNEPVRILLDKTAIHRYSNDSLCPSSNDFLDRIRSNRKLPSAYYISPLNFNAHLFGYCAVSFGKFPVTYSRLYTQWIKYVNTSIEKIMEKSSLKTSLKKLEYSVNHSEETGLLNTQGLSSLYQSKLAEYPSDGKVSFIHLELSELKKTYFQCGHAATKDILRNFADILRSSLEPNEICGALSPSSYAVIAFGESRADDIFYFIRQRLESCIINNGSHYGTAFSMGEASSLHADSPDFNDMLQKAAVNHVHSYSHEDTGVNPQFEKICRLRSELMKNPEINWKVSEISEKMFISKSYLQKIYKQYFNRSIIEELIYFRLDKAKKLLAETDLTVTDISRDCGYTTYNYFVRQFRTIEGISPTEYREQNKYI